MEEKYVYVIETMSKQDRYPRRHMICSNYGSALDHAKCDLLGEDYELVRHAKDEDMFRIYRNGDKILVFIQEERLY